MADSVVTINRAPVLTLWGAVVAERLGFDRDSALTLGKTVAGLNAQAKGRALGIFTPRETQAKGTGEVGETFRIELMGREVPCTNTGEGLRAVTKGKPVEPAKVVEYLKKRFGDSLDEARDAMERLAASWDEDDLETEAFRLYERFRPEVASGQRGWGQKGTLDLDLIRSLAEA